MKLVVVESPTKARTLSRFLDDEFEIESSMGHVRDLPKKKIGVDTEKGFEPQYVVVPSKKKTVTKLKKLARDAKEVYLATDPDREGEAIAYHVEWLIKKDKQGGKNNFKRVSFHEITKSAIQSAMEKPGDLNMELVHAQQARRVLDRLVGYTLSPVLWKKVRRGLSAGRVQSVALRLIVEKEEEREAFEPKEYWYIYTDLKGKKKNEEFRAKVERYKGESLEVGSEKEAEKVEKDLEKESFVVSDVSTDKYERSPYPPFTTSTLQQTAVRFFGWSSKWTMSVAQALYENGYITYHRTDSFNLAKSSVSAARVLIKNKYGEKYLPKSSRQYKTKSKSAQEAHEAIRPTDLKVDPEKLKGRRINKAHKKLYELIRRRMLQSQMVDSVYDKDKIIIEAGEYEIEVRGSRLVFDGWEKLNKNKGDEEGDFPEVEAGEKLRLKEIELEQKFTNPPARYSEATLIKELEKRGIGRPSTYATIVSTITNRKYVVKEEKRFKPTSIGTAVNGFLVEHFDKVMAYDFTAEMEDDLDKIAEGKKDWVKVVGDFWKPFYKKVEEVEEKAERVQIPVEHTGKKCPKCDKGEVVIRMGKYGKFLSCSSFPDCDWSDEYIEYVEGAKCEDCGGRVVVRRTRKGRTFYGCENYPKCEWASWKKPKVDEGS